MWLPVKHIENLMIDWKMVIIEGLDGVYGLAIWTKFYIDLWFLAPKNNLNSNFLV